MFFEKLIYYLDLRNIFRKKKEKEEINVRMMHGINRISIYVFLFALVVMFVKFCR